jgi:hypothetical protein
MASQFAQQKEQQKLQQQQEMAELEAGKRLGIDLSGLPPESRKKAIEFAFQDQFGKGKGEREFGQQMQLEQEKSRLRREEKAAELAGKHSKDIENYQKNVAPLEAGLETISQMEKLRKKGNLGFGSSYKGMFSPETRRDRGEYEQLGKSLISLASNIPIRNQMEFATLAEKLYDPSVTDDEAAGILNAMKRIISGNLQRVQLGGFGEDSGISEGQPPMKERKPLTSFHR